MNARRIRAAARAALIAVFMLAGCTDVHEMKYQSFITAIGLDATEENDIKVSALELLFDRHGRAFSEESSFRQSSTPRWSASAVPTFRIAWSGSAVSLRGK